MNPDETPITAEMTKAEGTEGDVYAPDKVTPDDRPLTGLTEGDPGAGSNEPYDEDAVEENPQMTNGGELGRLLGRHYPPHLRDAGVEGRVDLTVVVGTDGRVEPGSVKVVSATHDGLAAASIRMAERMRFRPGKVNDLPVRVKVTLPIHWKLSN